MFYHDVIRCYYFEDKLEKSTNWTVGSFLQEQDNVSSWILFEHQHPPIYSVFDLSPLMMS